MANEFGKEIERIGYHKNAVGMKKDSLVALLTDEDIKNIIVYVDQGRTDIGWEFATIRIYSKKKESTGRSWDEIRRMMGWCSVY